MATKWRGPCLAAVSLSILIHFSKFWEEENVREEKLIKGRHRGAMAGLLGDTFGFIVRFGHIPVRHAWFTHPIFLRTMPRL